MQRVRLVPHDLAYAGRIFKLTSAPQVRDALGLRDEKVEDTENYIRFIIKEEADGRALSRVVLNEYNEVIGITTLMSINRGKRRCHIGSWLGHNFWGQGYNQEAKMLILKEAFLEMGMEHVFAGARKVNIRSQKAQEKLPYMRLNVEQEFPEEHVALETKEKQPCVLNAVYRQDFLEYLREYERGM